MRNVLAIFYYILSGQNSEVWFLLTITVPFIAVIALCIILSCTTYGRFINRALKAERFIKRNGLITNENKDLFYAKCIKGLPALFTSVYLSRINCNTRLSNNGLKPLFKGTKKLILAIFDMIWMILIVITTIVCLMEGAEGRMILFCALAPLPLIIINRTLVMYLTYLYNSHAQGAYSKLVNIVNDEYNGLRAAADNKSAV